MHSLIWTFVGWLCWGLTSQSTIFQSCRDGAIASWVINQYFRGVKCLAQGHNTAEVGLEPRTSRSRVRHSTTEPPRSPGPLLFTYSINRFSHDVAHLIPNMVIFKKFNHNWHFRGTVQDWRLAVNVFFFSFFFSAFMICHFSLPSYTLQQNSDSLQVNIYLTGKHFRITYTDNLNFFRAG